MNPIPLLEYSYNALSAKADELDEFLFLVLFMK